jgi:hypothetical protein
MNNVEGYLNGPCYSTIAETFFRLRKTVTFLGLQSGLLSF